MVKDSNSQSTDYVKAGIMYTQIKECRAGGGPVEDVMSLGNQAMTGIFPKPKQEIEFAPLDLVWSEKSGLLQLKHTCNLDDMYGTNYGYRSGLNKSMVEHLRGKAKMLQRYLGMTDVVLDIGSNDGTLLSMYEWGKKIGMDPTAGKFHEYYPENVMAVCDFFSAKKYFNVSSKKAKVITSISMFYDLPDPIAFAKEVGECLADDGIWHLEMSYMPTMLRQGCYDTICHEHLEYYSLTAIKRIIELAGLHIQSVSLNDTNGGSFALNITHEVPTVPCPEMIWLLQEEFLSGLRSKVAHFELRAMTHRSSLVALLSRLSETKTVIGYGASTKGNAVLQYCGITTELLPYIAEVNPDKYGCITPGSNIPIIPETEARAMKPDYMLVMPWHFKTGILKREREYLDNGGKLIFPFPYVEIVG